MYLAKPPRSPVACRAWLAERNTVGVRCYPWRRPGRGAAGDPSGYLLKSREPLGRSRCSPVSDDSRRIHFHPQERAELSMVLTECHQFLLVTFRLVAAPSASRRQPVEQGNAPTRKPWWPSTWKCCILLLRLAGARALPQRGEHAMTLPVSMLCRKCRLRTYRTRRGPSPILAGLLQCYRQLCCFPV